MKGSSSISTAKKRLLNELKQFNENDENETILATPHEDNLMIWDCIFLDLKTHHGKEDASN